MKLPKLVITDIDGVWTDGGMFYDQNGNELKKFNTSDSAGVLFCNLMNIPIAIITGEDTQIVARRAKKLKIELLYQGISDKLTVAKSLCEKLDISLKEVAFIGDDIGDIELLKAVGYSCCPNDSPDYIKRITHVITSKSGGDGAFREFVERILKECGVLEDIINNKL
jgi:YrbI family 3-deoxy-D-manno-octulosonate 8-phosphate phosphatase